MRLGFALLVGSCLLFQTQAAVALTEMSGDEMGGVTGHAGIAFEWDLRINAGADGTPDATLPLVQRRLALNIAERPGEWLVFKGFSGRIYFPTFYLDAGRSGVSPTIYADTSRFVDGLGSPVSPYDQPNLLLRFPEEIEFWNFRIAGMAIERDNTPIAATPGFLQDPTDSKSFIGLAITNSIPGFPATLKVEGTVRLFGF
ncbi:MAG: hypothetical protein ACK4SX_05525 [Alcanivoracaceae bacterium]